MHYGWFVSLLLGFSLVAAPAAAAEAELRINALRPGSAVTVDRELGDDRALISVVGLDRKPQLGLGAADFTVTRGARTANITAVQPIAESLEVPRHVVLVLDNSDSMRQRHAVQALLDGVDELLRIIRPIDQVDIVVFDSRQTVSMGGRDLHVRSFRSNDAAELKAFVGSVYADGMTPATVLYEAMLAGLDLVRGMPADEPKFMVVFSDGEDLNSSFKSDAVFKAAQGLARFDAYAIDYMPGAATDRFLAEFVARNRGSIWKATSETNLVPIFQSVASKMQHYYVVSYLFPPTGTLAVTPTSLNIDEIHIVDAVAPAPQDAAPAPMAAPVARIDAAALTLLPAVESAYGFAGWKVTVSNAGGNVAELAGEGPPAAGLTVPLPTGNLPALAAGGDLQVRLEVQDRKGQRLVLAVPPVKVNRIETRGGLAVTPETVTIEEIRTIDASPMLGHIYFAEGSSEIPPAYVRLAGPEATAGFDGQQFRDTLEKYYQVLNLVGRRLTDHPEATLTLIGCNANTGKEKGSRKLSARRAEAVRDYLLAVWNIAPGRIQVESRNLPETPSTSRSEEGRAENRRVEIRSADPAILDLVRSTYLANRISVPALVLKPDVVAPHGVVRWQIAVANAGGTVAELAGEGAPAAQVTVPLPTGKLPELAAGGDLAVRMELEDRTGQRLAMGPLPVRVDFVQSSRRLAQKQGLQVEEKYALILFDFDKDTIDARNQVIVDTIVARLRELPQASVAVVGHTDNIGRESYNLKLSERRAQAVYGLLAAAYGENAGERIRHAGVGQDNPLYDNVSPETRAFNRTVTVTLEYLAAE